MPAPSPHQPLKDWLRALSHATPQHDIGAAMRLFVRDAFGRDLAAFTRNAIARNAQDAISDMLRGGVRG
jgi:hypothetical protein